MELDFATIPPIDRYKILTAVVVPRPIAWVTTISTAGVINVAPFSFFNAMGSNPAIVALGISGRGKGVPKDTMRNIAETGEFVVNVVTYAAREVMNRTAADYPPETSELTAIGLATQPSVTIRPPRLTISPVNLECRKAEIVEVGRNQVTIGEILHARIADEFYDAEKGYVAVEKLDLIGRMHGRGWYARTSDLFEMPRVNADGTLA